MRNLFSLLLGAALGYVLAQGIPRSVDRVPDSKPLAQNLPQAELLALREENHRLRRELEALQLSAGRSAENAADSVTPTRASIQAARNASAIRDSFLDATIRTKLQDMQQAITLSAEEQRQVSEALRAKLEEGGVNADLNDVVEQIVDPTRALQYRNFIAQRDEKRRRDEENMRVATVSRALTLNPQQEIALRSTFAQIEQELEPQKQSIKDMMTGLHNSPGEGNPVETFEKFKQANEALRSERRRLLLERMQPSLSTEQFDKLVNEQAGAPDGLFGIRNY